MTDLLHLEGICVQFGGLKAVDDVTIRVPRGERRAIIGPNGAGKTTLFNAITGMVRATSGRVMFDGRDVTRMPVHARAAIGMSRTFQITNLFPNLTVAENMRLALRGLSPRKFSLLGGGSLTAEEHARADKALGVSRLHARRDVVVKEMSYGEQRQLELAMALVAQPKLLLLDEPAAGLSPSERVIVSDIIRALPRDLTLVLIEHDMDLVLSLVDYVTCLNNGKMLVEAPPAEIRTNTLVQDVYLGKARHHA
ncbi:ABC transporter ATP-binding protein [Azorhizobium oxalatiphilum]|uniref:ABC transporter ATP-binding protein n=1 Tax=Azorhizobium oxalatiphilum TaxID=980631 RepID=UPI001AEEEFDA|nr:ABC transporter ATP-binding protein [Azorhizobium oxalatiphilum]